jgi:hypothetical protein
MLVSSTGLQQVRLRIKTIAADGITLKVEEASSNLLLLFRNGQRHQEFIDTLSLL